MLRMLEAQAPVKQTATDTINTLSARLNNATLLEDRRAAILGLRSFAKEYPASVASGALRGLISCLTKDLDDVDTTKVVLETLLMLFNPNEDSPEASDDIALWLADEFTQHQDNIKVLLELLETYDFYSRLYSIQLITAMFAARPERTQECILNAALGASRLVATLDDSRDAVRNAGLLLLSDLTQSSTELQKLVAFESAFDRVFNLIRLEGSLSQGGIIVQDCLDLLANLVRYNTSNQSLFRESGCVSKLADLLQSATPDVVAPLEEEHWPSPQKAKNIWGLLAVVRLFLVPGSVGTQMNQTAFHKHGLLQQVLNLAFSPYAAAPIRAEALHTCSDMIRGTPILQASFAQLQVTPLTEAHCEPVQNGATNGNLKAYVVDALLELVLAPPPGSSFELRLAACECIKAYFYHHEQIRLHFLHRAIDGYLAEEDETPNVLTTLLRENAGIQKAGDPYRVWFAAVVVLHLIRDDPVAKKLLMSVSEGDAEKGEEVVSSIQIVTGNLIAGIQKDEDDRVVIGFFMLLCAWLFEDAAAINDFLGEGSALQILMQTASSLAHESATIKGLCAVVLGIVYEFSTKDSPIPRRKLQPILTSGLGREQYIQALSQLRQHPLIRDFEVYTQGGPQPAHGHDIPAYAYFDETFVEFLKDNFSRFRRAIDRDPGIEAQITSGAEGIDRDLVDSLKAEIEAKTQSLQKAEAVNLELERQLNHEQASHRRDQETAAAETQRLKQTSEAMQRDFEKEVEKLQAEHRSLLHERESVLLRQVQHQDTQIKAIRKETSEQAERTKEYYERSIAQLRNAKKDLEAKVKDAIATKDSYAQTVSDLQRTVSRLRADVAEARRSNDGLQKTLTTKENEIAGFEAAKTKLREAAEDEQTKVSMLEAERSDLEASIKKLEVKVAQWEKVVVDKEEARSSAQTELDDLLLLMQDLEEKRARDKKRLKELGEEISDVEDNGDGESGEGSDEG